MLIFWDSKQFHIKFFTNKVIDCVNSYSFDIKFIFIRVSYEKVSNYFKLKLFSKTDIFGCLPLKSI